MSSESEDDQVEPKDSFSGLIRGIRCKHGKDKDKGEKCSEISEEEAEEAPELPPRDEGSDDDNDLSNNISQVMSLPMGRGVRGRNGT